NAFFDDLKDLSETAEAYGVGYDIVEAAGHEIMLDITWEDAAKVVFDRIQERIINKWKLFIKII
ncbi:8367_t:CDS:1, partial [Funneliformis geosporum]